MFHQQSDNPTDAYLFRVGQAANQSTNSSTPSTSQAKSDHDTMEIMRQGLYFRRGP